MIVHLDEVTVKVVKHPSKEPKTDYELDNWSLESIKFQLQLVKDINLRYVNTQEGQKSKLPSSALINNWTLIYYNEYMAIIKVIGQTT